MALTMYGIPNCDTIRKARLWLEEQGVAFAFHDYRKDGVDAALLEGWAERIGWEALLNRAGTTFRNLPEADRAGLTRERAIALMVAQPALIRRPVLTYGELLEVGFRPERYAALLS